MFFFSRTSIPAIVLAVFLIPASYASTSNDLTAGQEPNVSSQLQLEVKTSGGEAENFDVPPGADRKPAITGAASDEPTEHPELYLDMDLDHSVTPDAVSAPEAPDELEAR